eukprot:455630-Pleurochrysis_carterae.AAC.1
MGASGPPEAYILARGAHTIPYHTSSEEELVNTNTNTSSEVEENYLYVPHLIESVQQLRPGGSRFES